jgi:hypothetical protein
LSIHFQADNDLKFGIVKAVRGREHAIEFVSAQESGLESVSDPELLDRAARKNRVLVSHDRRTMLYHFRAHLAAGKTSLACVTRNTHRCSRKAAGRLQFRTTVSTPGT